MEHLLYTIVPSERVLDNPSRKYVLKVRDLPKEKKPRERLLAHGPESLTSAELLAVILNTGTKKEEVLALSERIMQEYGDRGIMNQRSATKMIQELQIPSGKAAQITAIAELGRRFFSRNQTGVAVIRTPEEVFAHTRQMASLSKEHLRGIYLNSHYKVIHEEIISIGTIDANLIHPREVFKPAIEYAAAAVILVHNHPSGEADPSEADIEITKQLVEAGSILGIALIDHIVITEKGFQSVPVSYQN